MSERALERTTRIYRTAELIARYRPERDNTGKWRGLAMLIAGVFALAFCVPPALAAEVEPSEPPSERTHQLLVCLPGAPKCEERGRPSGGVACDLNAASERLQRELPSGTHIWCKRVRS